MVVGGPGGTLGKKQGAQQSTIHECIIRHCAIPLIIATYPLSTQATNLTKEGSNRMATTPRHA
eukprot:15482073-Alexandrium_andersonii.AAC.1